MANTQSKCIPYAKDRHRLTNTNVALATEGGNAEMLQQRRKQIYSLLSTVQISGTSGSLCSPALPDQEWHTMIPVAPCHVCSCYFCFLPRFPDIWEEAGARQGSPDPSATSRTWGDERFPTYQHLPPHEGGKTSGEQYPLEQAFTTAVNYCAVWRRHAINLSCKSSQVGIGGRG